MVEAISETATTATAITTELGSRVTNALGGLAELRETWCMDGNNSPELSAYIESKRQENYDIGAPITQPTIETTAQAAAPQTTKPTEQTEQEPVQPEKSQPAPKQ